MRIDRLDVAATVARTALSFSPYILPSIGFRPNAEDSGRVLCNAVANVYAVRGRVGRQPRKNANGLAESCDNK